MAYEMAKPSIIVSLNQPFLSEQLKQILYGAEEEGIPFETMIENKLPVIERAYRAAQRSSLAVGIASDQQMIVIHYRHLPEQVPLFVMKDLDIQPKELLRNFGANAARLVKGMPFKPLIKNNV